MHTSARIEKRKRVLLLRDHAVAMALARGRWTGNFDYRAQLTQAIEFEERRLKLEFWSPRWPQNDDPGEQTVLVKIDGMLVLHVRWSAARSQTLRYDAGAWERQIA
jgi:hypothetical protein